MSYVLGIIFAISAGSIINFGVLLQKKIINDHLDEPEFLKSLAKNPTWMIGLLLQVFIGGVLFYMIAQVYLGPVLVPGLMSAGMIVLAIGSVKILNETLHKEEIIGILLMIMGIILLSISQLSIDMSTYNILEQGFITRITTFTCIYSCMTFLLHIFTKKTEKGKGVLFAIESGIIYSLSSVWIAPMITILTHLFGVSLLLGELLLFIPAIVITILATIYGIIFSQKAFKEGQANLLSPLIGVPDQLTLVMAYFVIFILTPPSPFSMLFLLMGLATVISSTFLLANRQVKLEEIKK